MNKGIRFTDEFKQDAVAQVVQRVNYTNGNASTTSLDLAAHTTAKPLANSQSQASVATRVARSTHTNHQELKMLVPL